MKYQVMPALTPIEYEALKADIAERGVLVPVEVDENGDMLDGHHRVMAWQELRSEGVNLPDYPRLIRSGLTEEQKRNHARSLNVLRRHLSPEQQRQVMQAMRADNMSIRQIMDATGKSYGSVYRAVSGDSIESPEFVTGKDGKQYPAQQQPKPEAPPTMFESTVPTWTNGTNVEDDEDEYIPEPTRTFVVLDEWGTQETIRVEEDEEIAVVKRPHVVNNSGNNEWYTPEEYIAAARNVLGTIDLDPASSDIANMTVKAATYYTAETNGLEQEWAGNVWMNPPYAGELIGQFTAKLVHHVQQYDVREAIVLVNNATETAWFQELVAEASAVAFPRGRVRFWKPDGTPGAPLQGQAILYIGANGERFINEFARFGWCANVEL